MRGFGCPVWGFLVPSAPRLRGGTGGVPRCACGGVLGRLAAPSAVPVVNLHPARPWWGHGARCGALWCPLPPVWWRGGGECPPNAWRGLWWL